MNSDFPPSVFALGDFNVDGRLDIAVANVNSSTIDVFLAGQFSGLTVTSTHPGNFGIGKSGTYQIAVSNPLYAATSGAITVTDTLPAGFTAVAISGTGWTCTLASLTCTRSDTLYTQGSIPTISIAVNVAANLSASTVYNHVSVVTGNTTAQSTDTTVLVLPASVTLTTSPASSTLGQPVTLTASVTAGATGSVAFFDGNAALGIASVTNAQASLTVRLPNSGNRLLLATYLGDSVHGPGSSPVRYQLVSAAPSSGFDLSLSYPTGASPAAIASGDFNGDGKVDLVTANYGANSVSVLLGNGNGAFRAHVDYATGTQPSGVVVGDFNLDGKQDLAVINSGSNNLTLLFGNGDGTFQPAVNYPLPNQPVSLAAADVNGDGKQDLLIVTNYDNLLHLLLGNGDGTFYTSAQTYTVNGQVFTVGDFNSDGKPDIAYGYSSIATQLGNGDGTFQPAVYSAGLYPNALAAGDFNNDGRPDMVAVDTSSGLNVLPGKGDGSFAAPVRTVSGSPLGVSVADVNGDGKLDLIAANSNANNISVFYGNGDGTLQPPILYAAGSAPKAVLARDFNGDGVTDLAILDGNGMSVLLGFATPILTAASSHTQGFALGQVGAVYTLTVTNQGTAASSGAVTLSDTLPSGLTATSMTGSGWSCTLAALACTRSDSLAIGSSYPAVTLVVTVSANAASSVTNLVSATNANALGVTGSDLTLIGAVLTIAKSHAGNFTRGQSVAVYSVTVSNSAGASAASGLVTVTESLPAGLTAISMSGTNWNCAQPAGPCTRSDTLQPGATYPSITVMVSVASNAALQVTNHVSVSGGGSAAASADDVTNINPPVGALRFVPVTPCRVADTRRGAGPLGAPSIGSGGTRDFPIPSSSCGIPASAQAYSLNVAVVPAGPLGYLTAWPSGQPQPVASTINSVDGRVKSTAAIIPAGSNGSISVFASNATDVILDVNGYFVPTTNTSALAFYPITPCRVADTRKPNAPLGGPYLASGLSRTFPVLNSACGIPANAQAYSLNFAAVPFGPLGYITAYPTGHSQPTVASLNAPTGTITANAVIVPAGTNGSVDVYASNATNLVIDIDGYFAPMATGGLSLYPVTPCRVLDTRKPAGSPPFTGEIDVPVTASACSVPAAAQAYVFNATVAPSGAFGFLTLWPQGQSRPTAATLNAVDGIITSNLAVVPTANGSISAYGTNPTQLILDIFAYFAQ